MLYALSPKTSIFVSQTTKTKVVEDFLDNLNESQRQAVLYNEGASLVIAGAGSGKTRVLTYKIAYLLQNGYLPHQILALTFTNKAAREMKERLASIVGSSVSYRLWMGTFHSIFLRILRTHAHVLGFNPNFTIYDSADSRSLIKTIVREMQLDDKLYKPATVQAIISSAKNALVTPKAYAADKGLMEADIRSKRNRMSDIYQTYWGRCFQAGAMDFDDLLLYTNILFRDHPDVLRRYQQQFGYLLVDEYQDTNFAQHLIVKQLVKEHNRVCVVGDDAQSIYSFRGAQISNILNINIEYPGCRTFKLEQNYRSTQNIVDAANSLIKKNKGQIAKDVFSKNEKGEKIPVISAYSDFEEGYIVANKISEMHSTGAGGYNDFAILYRTNAQSRILEEALRKRNIPYKIYGGLSFYQRKEIKDIVSYFRVTVNPDDEEALKRIINYPTRGIGDTTVGKIAECAVNHSVSLWRVIEAPADYGLSVNSGTATKLDTFRKLINQFRAEAELKDVGELAEQVIRQSGMLAEVYKDRTPENLSRQENIQELLNGILEFCTMRREEGREDISLTDFLSEVSLASDLDKTDDDQTEKVTLMTVHASKGLEFRNVFVVGMEEDLFPSLMSKGSELDLEEERRLFYVAITRAEQHCVLSHAASRFRNGKTETSSPSRFLRDIDSQYLLTTERRMPDEARRSESADSRSGVDWGRSNAPEYVNRRESPLRQESSTGYHRPKLTRMETAVETEAPRQSVGNLQIGSVIKHDRFGMGQIVSIEGADENCKIGVEFENVGKKLLLLKFVKFTLIKP